MSKKKPIKSSTKRDLVGVGQRHVQIHHHARGDQNIRKPTTSRALVLRDGKYGARGTGEIMLSGRISGREKLDLLAEDLVSQKSRTALMAPLDLDKCIRIADSQYNAYLDDIADLQDPDSFYDKIVAELVARSTDNQQNTRDASHVASVVSTRIHNAYMVASGWNIVTDILRDLQKLGLNDTTARTQLESDDNLRSRYLALYDIVGVLVDLGQAHFSILAMTTPHYSRYFKEEVNASPGEPSVGFDWASIKDACKSFLDSIIIELCFPRAPYPRRILYHILHDAVDESSREAKRFPQAMWDAVGDLSISLEVQELLENPLLGPQGERLRTLPRQMPEQYESWLDAQIYSKRASELYANFKGIIDPLERTKDPTVLENMWKSINLNYQATSNLSIESLWQLDDALRRTPQWSSFFMPSLRTYEFDSDEEESTLPLLKGARQQKSGGKNKPKKPLAITDGRTDDDSNNSMPELQSVSEDSDEINEDIPVSENDEEEESDDNDESDYDSGEDEAYRTMLREAMDAAMAIPEFFDPKSTVPEFDALAEERKGNPFVKLLGSLRGRMFTSDPKLSSTTRTEPRKSFFRQKSHVKGGTKQDAFPSTPTQGFNASGISDLPIRSVPKKGGPSDTQRSARRGFICLPPSVSTGEKPKDYRVNVEDAEDEEDVTSTAGKKKKPKKKKKKKKIATNELPTVHEGSVPVSSTPPKNPSAATLVETPVKVSPSKSSVSNVSSSSLAHASTSSLPIQPTVAQSTHSYLQDLNAPKEKIKSRPDHASLFSEKKGLLSKPGSRDKTKQEIEDNNENDPTANKKSSWFSNLGKRTTGYMHKLLRTNADEKGGALKWDGFLKVMRDMGFKYDPSTAGSSVRFDPPNPGDRSITFHKPHPDSTLHAHNVRDFGKKLKRYYGWSEEDFLRRTGTI